ncbi:MAG: hypothetical protein ABIJ34_08010 [archaeon]
MGWIYRIEDDYSGAVEAFQLTSGEGFLEVLTAAGMPNYERKNRSKEGWVRVPICCYDLTDERVITSAMFPLLYDGLEVKSEPCPLVLRLQYHPKYPEKILFFVEGIGLSKSQLASEFDIFRERTHLDEAALPVEYTALIQQMDITERIIYLQSFSQNI